MSDPELRTVVVERDLAFPPERLWRALTQPHLIEEWLMRNNFKPIEGQRFTLRREPQPGANVVIECEVLQVVPNRTLSYTWSAFGLESVVTFTLTPTVEGTHLKLEQHGFRPDQELAYRGATAAWKQFARALEELLARID